MLLAAALATLTIIATFTSLLCCCCWRYHVRQQQKRKQRLDQNNFHNNSCGSSFDQKNKKYFGRFNLPFLQQFSDSTLTKKTTGTTASTSSTSSSYCNGVSSRDTHSCAPLYLSSAGAASFTESLIYEKAISGSHNTTADTNVLSHCYSTPPITNLPNKILPSCDCKPSGVHCCADFINLHNKGINFGNDSEYYSCIQASSFPEQMASRSKSGINLNYCAPPLSGQYRTYRHPQNCQLNTGGKAQVLISYGNNTIAYPPYIFHSRSNYCLNNENYGVDYKQDEEVMHDKKAYYSKFNGDFNASDSECYVSPAADLLDSNDETNHYVSQCCRPPSFIAPPPPSTIPPPPIDYMSNLSLNNAYHKNSNFNLNRQCFNEML